MRALRPLALTRQGLFAASVAAALALFAAPAYAAPKKIAFSDQIGANDLIFTVWPDGTHRRRITHGTSNEDRQPSWSPHRTQIVFVRQSGAPSHLFTISASGHGLHQIPHTAFANFPAWSPQGGTIAFVAERSDFKTAIYTIQTNGHHRHRLTPFGGSTEPAWSPSGKSIVYANAKGIVKMSANGKHKHLIRHFGSDPSWSPNGKLIAFDGPSTKSGVAVNDIFTMHSDGSHLRDITHSRPATLCIPAEECPRHDAEPDWSPDGTRIAFDESSSGNGDVGIYTVAPNGGHTRHVTASGHSASW